MDDRPSNELHLVSSSKRGNRIPINEMPTEVKSHLLFHLSGFLQPSKASRSKTL